MFDSLLWNALIVNKLELFNLDEWKLDRFRLCTLLWKTTLFVNIT